MSNFTFDKFSNEYYKIHSKNIEVSGESPNFFAEYKFADAVTIAAYLLNLLIVIISIKVLNINLCFF
jgi:hypothetical protein